ncbi:dihydroorotate dehydrogenase-like protein [Porphyromonas levii]|uniref:dihydroorotate dehydrogenase-like protein n=1 Tax=Porphyromonas levii TaxID=28114 RepID=UPI001B8D00A1|nr:dihydroorotate dehydrogenase-like protein [Porphyromonas levii]MBR8713681.1 NAD-dependent dihydropyrimidine dehydrogenase subunit PreA [Porphyromonas levii]MBR8715710.1 NAD-dependent dihydropyrimidine dehydrogenase subunit PreA [Porphyromonas levii]MBR8728242.1 NAD-dependent dihydropyrimidine dehydrogenase subunit PreA [Porphyromonas levii]MBR8736575.1 NAD-dependent dihydropyrimidine dehydrogenase subunit PreA [Porphyromonas levii]MBR8764079.1 NAD-dependent dihydropyrimidine dehydrogenase s
MADISTLYAGKLLLRSPFIVASSGLTKEVKKIKELADAGAGAIVLKSIFEEEIEQDITQMTEEMNSGYHDSAAMDYLQHYVKEHALQSHVNVIREAKQAVDIPVIASVNAYKSDSWVTYAKELIDAGADALECNVMRLETKVTQPWGESEQDLIKMVQGLRKVLPNTPLIIKLSKYFTNVVRLARDLKLAGADAVVLFNRTFMPDIDIEEEEISRGSVLSHQGSFSDSLRYTGLVRGGVPDLSIALSNGARDGKDLVKGLLAGADAVQYCSALYKGGANVIREANQFLSDWMGRKQYHEIKEFKSKLAATRVDHATMYQRSQFMRYHASEDANPTAAVDFSKPDYGHI